MNSSDKISNMSAVVAEQNYFHLGQTRHHKDCSSKTHFGPWKITVNMDQSSIDAISNFELFPYEF